MLISGISSDVPVVTCCLVASQFRVLGVIAV